MAITWPTSRRVRHLTSQVAQLKHTVETMDVVLSGRSESEAGTRGNPYPTYNSKVAALSKKYNGTDTWGNQATRNIVDMRASFIMGAGVRAVVHEGIEPESVSREMEFIEEFISRNNLDQETPQAWAVEAEIEGKCLVRLFPADGQIDARHVPWTQQSYTVETENNDYGTYTGVTFALDSGTVIPPSEFVYARFGGRVYNVNETPSKTATILRYIEALDKAFADWRKIDAYFASPTATFKVETKQQADQLIADLRAMNWKIGQMLVSTADFSLQSASMAGVESILQEIAHLARIISGHTGIPVHFLGFPELMSNRATAENLFEMIAASTSRERAAWRGFYDELFSKVLAMANEKLNGGFQMDAIGAEIPEDTAAKLAELTTVWLPIRESNEISRRTFLSHVPGLHVDSELEEIEKDSPGAGQFVTVPGEETP